MKRIFIMLIIWVLGSTSVIAATFGTPIVQSKLGQPLDIKIPILNVAPTAAIKINASISKQQPHDTIAKEQQNILSHLTLKVIQQNNHIYLNVSSRNRINEPFLRLPIEIQLPEGKLQDYVIVFFDPVDPTVATKATNDVKIVKNKQRLYGPTQSQDRLWQIAKAYQQAGSTTSIQQLMLAIFLANPHAFVNHNMNALKQGQYLHIPSLHAAAAYSQQQAVATINQQFTGNSVTRLN